MIATLEATRTALAVTLHLLTPRVTGVPGSVVRPMFTHLATPAADLDPRDVYAGTVEVTETGVVCGHCTETWGELYGPVRHASVRHVEVCAGRLFEIEALDAMERMNPYL
jgi:hypothetical protein